MAPSGDSACVFVSVSFVILFPKKALPLPYGCRAGHKQRCHALSESGTTLFLPQGQHPASDP